MKIGSEEERYEYLETFVLSPLEGCFEQQMIVDLTTVMPLPKATEERVKELKQAELEHEHRVKFRKKLALFIGRAAPDMSEDQKIERPPRHTSAGSK